MKFITPVIVLLLASVVRADIVILNDGTQVEGRLTRTWDGWTITQSDGTSIAVKSEQVRTIEASRSPNSNAAADRLASLRRVAEHLSDLNLIIDRYNKFLLQNTDASVVEEADKDLAGWHQKLDQGLVKVGTQWVTPEQRDQLQKAAQVQALAAREFMRQSRVKEAQDSLQQALAGDPESPLALFLQGVLLYQKEQVSQARKSFEAANDAMPSYPPILNNLAVISWREKSYVAALNYYDLAMLAAPEQKLILDNTAAALHELPNENKQAPAVQKAARDFTEQDAQLQESAAKEGMFRWGSKWVTSKQLDDLKGTEARLKSEINDLSGNYDIVQQKIGEIDAEVDANLREMHRLQASVQYTDAGGNVTQLPLPQTYFTLENDNQHLAANKKVLVAQQEKLRVRAKELQASVPAPQFDKVQQIFGEDAAPGAGADSARAATQPDAPPGANANDAVDNGKGNSKGSSPTTLP
ncbi:MAG: tetratricopeptide repeat protein [Planctomycetota bacterium]|nr:tetratricopeptide repeat protein [Planctomycetota bacterium]